MPDFPQRVALSVHWRSQRRAPLIPGPRPIARSSAACVAAVWDVNAATYCGAGTGTCRQPREVPVSRQPDHIGVQRHFVAHAPRSKCPSNEQLRVGAARGIRSGYRSGRSACLSCCHGVLLTAARCADLPPRARESGQTGRGGRATTVRRAPLAGSDDAEARWAASGRSGGFAQSCGRRRSFDRGGPDPCSLHQQGSCGRFPCVSGRDPSLGISGVVRRGLAHSTSCFVARVTQP